LARSCRELHAVLDADLVREHAADVLVAPLERLGVVGALVDRARRGDAPGRAGDSQAEAPAVRADAVLELADQIAQLAIREPIRRDHGEPIRCVLEVESRGRTVA